MHCPFCPAHDTKVIDSRAGNGGTQIRRRRECTDCGARFTTFETAELNMPRIIKSDERRVSFDDNKIRKGMLKALEKRPISNESIEHAINSIKKQLIETGEPEVSASMIGDLVMAELRQLDEIAYVRFASVYRRFQDINAFKEELNKLIDK